MKTTKNLRDLSANLRHIANLLEAADIGETERPVSLTVYVVPEYRSSAGASEFGVVDQIAQITGNAAGWKAPIGGGDYAYYETELEQDAPWRLKCQIYAKRPSQAEALEAENVRLRAKLAEIEQIAAAEPPAAGKATCVCCNPGDCGDRQGHVRNNIPGEWLCNCGRNWPCEKAGA